MRKMFNSKDEKPNSGVMCDVSNCTYHDGRGYCYAHKINIGPSYANTTADTICATFKQKDT